MTKIILPLIRVCSWCLQNKGRVLTRTNITLIQDFSSSIPHGVGGDRKRQHYQRTQIKK